MRTHEPITFAAQVKAAEAHLTGVDRVYALCDLRPPETEEGVGRLFGMAVLKAGKMAASEGDFRTARSAFHIAPQWLPKDEMHERAAVSCFIAARDRTRPIDAREGLSLALWEAARVADGSLRFLECVTTECQRAFDRLSGSDCEAAIHRTIRAAYKGEKLMPLPHPAIVEKFVDLAASALPPYARQDLLGAAGFANRLCRLARVNAEDENNGYLTDAARQQIDSVKDLMKGFSRSLMASQAGIQACLGPCLYHARRSKFCMPSR